jgi:hypothetical protein
MMTVLSGVSCWWCTRVLARVNSFDSLGIYGPSPVAYLLIGPAVALAGVSGALLAGAVILTVAMVAVGLVPEVRTLPISTRNHPRLRQPRCQSSRT